MKILVLTALMLLGGAFNLATAVAAPADAPLVAGLRKVEGHYFITLKEPEQGAQRLIEKPDPALKNKPGFVPPVMGRQSDPSPDKKIELEAALGVRGEVVKVYKSTNTMLVYMDEQEAARLSTHPLVASVEQSVVGEVNHTQHATLPGAVPVVAPGWALDRVGQPAIQNPTSGNANSPGVPDSTYYWWHTGVKDKPPYGVAGEEENWLYILDMGMDFTNPSVVAEFADPLYPAYNRAVGFGFNTGGQVCKLLGIATSDHGAMTASAAIGKTYGVGKRTWARIVNVAVMNPGDTNCISADPKSYNEWSEELVKDSFDWLAQYASRGSVVSMSLGIEFPYPDGSFYCSTASDGGLGIRPDIEASIKAAHAAGVITVVAAGNDGCNTNFYTPTRLNEVLTVGATDNTDTVASSSRTGSQIDVWAPGSNVNVMRNDGVMVSASGTSFSAPLEAGLIATYCQITITDGCITLDPSLDPTKEGMTRLFSMFRGNDIYNGGVTSTNPAIGLNTWNLFASKGAVTIPPARQTSPLTPRMLMRTLPSCVNNISQEGSASCTE